MSKVNIAEYVGRVFYFYSRNNVKIGGLTYDEELDRFVIVDSKRGKRVNPDDGLHCGDVYIVADKDEWKIVQCEYCNGEWKMLGSSITSNTCGKNKSHTILYVKDRKLSRFTETWIDDTFDLGDLPSDLVMSLVGE